MVIERKRIEVGQIDVEPEHDPFHRGQCKPTRTLLKLTYQNDEPFVYVAQDYDDKATPADEWHKRTLTFDLDDTENDLYLPDEQALRQYLESEAGQTLLIRIVSGHSIVWDGQNMMGQQNSNSLTAADELLNAINNLPHHHWELWAVEDWLNDYAHGELGTATTDEQIQWVVAELEAEAKEQHIVLDDSVRNYLTQGRNELRSVTNGE